MGTPRVWGIPVEWIRAFGILTCVWISATPPTGLVATGKSLSALKDQFPHL